MKPSALEKIKQNLRALRLKDMADILEAALEEAHHNQIGHLQFLDRLVQHQLRGVAERSFHRRIQQAKFPRTMTLKTSIGDFNPASTWNISRISCNSILLLIDKRF